MQMVLKLTGRGDGRKEREGGLEKEGRFKRAKAHRLDELPHLSRAFPRLADGVQASALPVEQRNDFPQPDF